MCARRCLERFHPVSSIRRSARPFSSTESKVSHFRLNWAGQCGGSDNAQKEMPERSPFRHAPFLGYSLFRFEQPRGLLRVAAQVFRHAAAIAGLPVCAGRAGMAERRSEHETHLGLMRMLSTPWETTRQASSKPTSNTGTAGFSSITHGRICPCQFTAKLHRPAWQLMSSARGSASSFTARLLLKRLCALPHGRRHVGIDIHRRATLAGDFRDPCDVLAVLPRHARADAHVNSPLAQQADAAHRPVKAVRRMAQARIGRAIRLSFAYSVRKPG